MGFAIDRWILRHYLCGLLGPVDRIQKLAVYIKKSENTAALQAVNRLEMDVANAIGNFFDNPAIANLEELCAANKTRRVI